MKKEFFLMIMVVCFAFCKASAQSVNGLKLSEINTKYIEISEVHPALSRKIWIRLEYGQKVLEENRDAVIKDDKGRKELEFNSALDCVIKLENYGYELFQAYEIQTTEASGRKYYILKKSSR